ncbi:leucyl-tRNA synthetase [Ophiocordyceps camponoti-floridani]|uniref:leucine--tRNA ligase n=1 Tax=Ophiocordyceps camponoti-floridani TaxID=2030778 RepID=A0A8H4VCH3_9HYPO|nr:leucyl-tRNA synthetase [Ophiocordyceps camponoti-floridani]
MLLLRASRRVSSRRLFILRLPATARRCYFLNLPELDTKWRRVWESSPRPAKGSHKVVLPMFPYPSGSLHLGHLRVYTVADVVARFYRLRGHDVALPIGWDAFGLPAENAALLNSTHPRDWTTSNIDEMKQQLQLINGSWDWSREISTCDPSYYKHTQKLFLMLHERGLVYQAEAEVNWDPQDKTVLANEQVDSSGRSWRSGAKVDKIRLKQWFLRISHFRQALLDGLDTLAEQGAWPEHVLAQQRNWLGRSKGTTIKFPLMSLGAPVDLTVSVFTTRPETLFGAQYIALASTHPLVRRLADGDAELQAFLDTLPGLPPDSKVGYLLSQLRAINPLAYHQDTPNAAKEAMPIYVAPYVLGDYGEGAVMGVPGHDARDHDFWRTHRQDEPIRVVLAASEDESTTVMEKKPFLGSGIMTSQSGPFKGKSSAEAGQMLVRMLQEAGLAEQTEKWRLRDWLISRQRYWGTPIPIVHCESCGAVTVPEDQLPVTLPPVKPEDRNVDESLETTCPRCGGFARREADTMDTFVDSSWYYARFADPHNDNQPLSVEAAAKWLPIDVYIGGVEHAILHLLYARFMYKFLATTSLLGPPQADVTTAEPFKRLITQGMVQGKTYIDPDSGRFLRRDDMDLSDPEVPRVASTGAEATVRYEKMSKSKYNGVDATATITQYGADATRAHILFHAPVGEVLRWEEAQIKGIVRWLRRLHEHVIAAAAAAAAAVSPEQHHDVPVSDVLAAKYARQNDMSSADVKQFNTEVELWLKVQNTISSVSKSFEEVYSLNTVVSHLMSLTNAIVEYGPAVSPFIRREAADTLVRLAAPVVPAVAEECWSKLHPRRGTLEQTASFPVEDGTASGPIMRSRKMEFAVQINGKVRGTVQLRMPPEKLWGEALAKWLVEAIVTSEQGRRFREGGMYDLRKAKRVVAVKGIHVISFVL